KLLHRRAWSIGAGRSDEHQAARTWAAVLRDIAGDQPAHREAGNRKAGIRPDDGCQAFGQRRADAPGRDRLVRIAGLPRAWNIRGDNHEIARQVLDVAQPMQPASSTAVQKHQRAAAAPDTPNDLTLP